MRPTTTILLAAALAWIGCSGEAGPTGPDARDLAPASALAERLSGGANWTLEVFGFTIPQVLGVTARKYADGRVDGRIDYHQVFQGERFRFVATVTCLEIYDGNRAKYGGELQRSNDPAFPPGTFIWFQTIDNGEGATSPPDRSTGSGFGTEAENEAFCASPAPPNPLFLADVNGNFLVEE